MGISVKIIALNAGNFIAFNCIPFSVLFSVLGRNGILRVHKNNLALEMPYL